MYKTRIIFPMEEGQQSLSRAHSTLVKEDNVHKVYILGEGIQIRLIALLLCSIRGRTTGLAELNVECHFHTQANVPCKNNKEMQLRKKRGYLSCLADAYSYANGSGWAAADDISGYCQRNVDGRK